MKKKILIIGCGNIGFNHFKALKRFGSKILIYLYDKKINKKKFPINKNIIILNGLKQSLTFDLVIISTNSNEFITIYEDMSHVNNISTTESLR